MPKLELLIVIINYKTQDMTIDCIGSVIPQLRDKQHIVVIDNNSQDQSIEGIKRWLSQHHHESQVSLIESKANLGFSGGNNLGLQFAEAEYYLLLNSDTLMRDGALDRLIDAAERQEDAGIISPRLEWPDGQPQISCFRYHSPASELIKSACTKQITQILRAWDIPIPLDEQVSSPQWTSFACVLIKKAVFDQVGLMDEGYFLYFEDADFCKLADNSGWKIINEPSAHVVHLRGGSSPVKSNIAARKRLPKYYYASRARFYAKHYGYLGLLFANCCWIFGRTISLARAVLGKKEDPTWLKEHIDIWTNFTSPMKPFRSKE